jgi:fermentation-respiration switch protein FrsA (DUF1100 family)
MSGESDPTALLRILTSKKYTFGITEYRGILAIVKTGYVYDELYRALGVNQFYLWSILDDPDYFPPAWVARILGIVKYKRPRRFFVYPDLEHIDNTIDILLRNMDPAALEVLRSRLNEGI